MQSSVYSLLKRRNFLLFTLSKVPLLGISGVRLKSISEKETKVRLPDRWINKNPFGSIYFASLSMAAEFCSGSTVFLVLEHQESKFKFLVTSFTADFVKKAKGEITFVNSDYLLLEGKLKAAKANEQTVVQTVVKAYDSSKEMVARFTVQWSFKKR